MITSSFCVASMRVAFNVVNGTYVCSAPATLYHVLEAVLASDWYALVPRQCLRSVVSPL